MICIEVIKNGKGKIINAQRAYCKILGSFFQAHPPGLTNNTLLEIYKAGYTAISRVRLGRGCNAQESTKKLVTPPNAP